MLALFIIVSQRLNEKINNKTTPNIDIFNDSELNSIDSNIIFINPLFSLMYWIIFFIIRGVNINKKLYNGNQ
jgi:hypothetical protein